MEIRRTLVMTLILLLGIAPARAELERAAGVAVGSASWSFDGDEYFETRSTAFKLFSEAALNDVWMLGVALISLGTIEDEVDGTVSFSADGLNLFVVRHWAFSDSVSLRAKAGVSSMNTKLDIDGAGEGRMSNTDVLLGVGAEAQVSDRMAVRLEYEMYRMALQSDDLRAGVFFLGLAYEFY